MPVSPRISEFLRELEQYSKRKPEFPAELASLIEAASPGRTALFNDAMFHAKFVVKSQEVMKRIGPTGEGYEKLSTEFSASVEKASALLKTLVKEAPDEVKQQFVRMFFSMDHDSFSRLMKLFADLSWVKNWQVDGRTMPYSDPQSS